MDFSKCPIPEEFLVVRPPVEKKPDDKKRKSDNANSNQKPRNDKAAKKPKFDKKAWKKQKFDKKAGKKPKSGGKWVKRQKPKNDDAAKGAKTKAGKKHQKPFDPQKPRFVPKKQVGSVVYLGHIPDGFHEQAMRGFFSQFGKVENVKLARSQSGKSRGFAFIKFQFPEVAQVVAETMNNYLLSDKLLKCRVMAGDSFKFYGDAPKKPEQRKKKALAKHDSSKVPDDLHRRNRKLLELFMEKKRHLAALGIDLKEEDVFDVAEKGPGSDGRYFEEASLTSEKEGKGVGEKMSAKKKKLADKRKKAKARRAAREREEKEEEEAISFALENLPGCKKLMGKLAKAAQSSVVMEEELIKEADEEDSEDDEEEEEDSDDGEEEESDEEEDEDMETTGVSLASTYKGHEIRQFGDSDSEIELNTPPGLKKRKVGSKAENSLAMDSSHDEEDEEEDGEDEDDVSMDSDDSNDSEEEGEGEGNDEGFEDTVSEKAVAVTPKQKTPKNSGKSPMDSQKKTAEKPGKNTSQPSSPKKTPQPSASKRTPQPPSSKKTPQKNQLPKTPASASRKKQQKKQMKDSATPLQFITGGSAKSTGKKAKKLSAETKREQLRRLEKQRRRSAPAGDALVSKKFKSTAFLDRSFNRGPSRRADEIDED